MFSNPLQLVYHAGFTGRADAPMLLLEDAGVPYSLLRDVKGYCSSRGGGDQNKGYPAFAAPALIDGDFTLAQTTAIMGEQGNATAIEHAVTLILRRISWSGHETYTGRSQNCCQLLAIVLRRSGSVGRNVQRKKRRRQRHGILRRPISSLFEKA